MKSDLFKLRVLMGLDSRQNLVTLQLLIIMKTKYIFSEVQFPYMLWLNIFSLV